MSEQKLTLAMKVKDPFYVNRDEIFQKFGLDLREGIFNEGMFVSTVERIKPFLAIDSLKETPQRVEDFMNRALKELKGKNLREYLCSEFENVIGRKPNPDEMHALDSQFHLECVNPFEIHGGNSFSHHFYQQTGQFGLYEGKFEQIRKLAINLKRTGYEVNQRASDAFEDTYREPLMKINAKSKNGK